MRTTKRDSAAAALALAIAAQNPDRGAGPWNRASDFGDALALGGAVCGRVHASFYRAWDRGGYGDGADDKQTPHANATVREHAKMLRKALS